MKLKEAVKEACKLVKESRTYWLAVDENGTICCYFEKPHLYSKCWNEILGCLVVQGRYTGKKHWTRAIRKFTL